MTPYLRIHIAHEINTRHGRRYFGAAMIARSRENPTRLTVGFV